MSSLPSYLSSGASSRAHHAFLVKLHRAQSEQEEDEVIRQEVRRVKQQLQVKGGASLSATIESLIILLHCTVYQNRPGIFDGDGAHDGALEDSWMGRPREERRAGGEDWALLAALQVVERSRDVREKRIGYLYLAERLPPGHELRLMLINTIRKDLESEEVAYILLALGAIIKQPSADLAPAVAPLLTTKTFLKHANPAVRQRALQALIALYLSPPSSLSDAERGFPLSMSKVVRLLASEQDLDVSCVLLDLLKRTLDSGVHHCQSTQERVYLLQQVTLLLGRVQPGSQVTLAAVQAARSILGCQPIVEVAEGDAELLRLALQGLDEELGRMMGESEGYSGLSGAFVMETCSLFDIPTRPDVELPTTLARCLKLLSDILHPASSSSLDSLPPANDHIFVLRCLAKIPLGKWDKAFGAEEMGTIMRGLESGDDSVRKATLRLLRTSAPQVLERTFDHYLTSIQQRSDLALPLQVSTELRQADKLRLALHETAQRALEVVFVSQAGRDTGVDAAESVRALMDGLGGEEESGELQRVWTDGAQRVRNFLEDQTLSFRSTFTARLLEPPSSPDPTVLALRALVAREYLGANTAEVAVSAALLKDLEVAEGSDLQEQILAAILWTSTCSKGEVAHQPVQERLGELLRNRKMSKRLRSHMEIILNLISAGATGEIKVQLSFRTREPEAILRAAEAVWEKHKPKVDHHDPSSSTHTLQSSAISPRPASDGHALRYGAYETPAVASNSGSRNSQGRREGEQKRSSETVLR